MDYMRNIKGDYSPFIYFNPKMEMILMDPNDLKNYDPKDVETIFPGK